MDFSGDGKSSGKDFHQVIFDLKTYFLTFIFFPTLNRMLTGARKYANITFKHINVGISLNKCMYLK